MIAQGSSYQTPKMSAKLKRGWATLNEGAKDAGGVG